MQLILEFFRADQADDPYAFRAGTQAYVLRTEGGGAETATLTWSPELLADLQAVRRPGRDPAVVQRVGDTLRRFLGSMGWSLHEADLTKAVQQGEPVIITLRFNAAELYALPWELLTLKATGQPLGSLAGVLLRYAWPETRTAPEQPEPRPEGGRILFAWSAASGAVPAAEHQQALVKACARGYHPFDAELDVLPALSVGRLQAALEQATRDGKPIAVLHILCHGGQRGQSFGLCWDGEEAADGAIVVDPGRLRYLLAPHAGQVRLVVLCACDSGNSGELGNHLGSVAQALHRAGVQAVVASRFPFSVAGSVRFCTALYGALLGPPGSLESAFVAARQELGRDVQSLDWASVQLYARAEDGQDSRPVVFRPYRGLLAFGAKHTRFFFGRDAERHETLSDLRALSETNQARFLVVAGASGTGKSSMVLSGAIPDLLGAAQDEAVQETEREAVQRALLQLTSHLRGRAKGPAVQQSLEVLSREVSAMGSTGQAWQVAVVRPGSDPMGALSQALGERKEPTQPFLLVVDQFEEIFTHTSDPSVRQAFASRLWSLAKEDTGVSCIVTLRVDFLGQCGELVLDESGLRLDRVAYDEAHRVFVAQLGPEQLLHAIEDPARLCGLRLQEGLAQRMIAEVGGEPGALPLLSYTLDLLWQRRRGRMLAADSYKELGGVVGALEQKANQLLAGLGADEKKQARQMLVRLVGIGEHGAIDTRRRVTVAALRERAAAQQATFDKVLAAFAQARLLVLSEQGGEVTVEVAHEALIRKWELLRTWVDEDRGMLAELQEVERWVQQWQEYKTLLQGDQLGYATRVLQKYPDDVSPTGRELIAASQRAQQDARQREQEQLVRQKRRAQIAAALGLLATLAAVSSGVLYRRAKANEREAHQQKDRAQQRLLDLYVGQGRQELKQGEPLRALVYLSRAYSETRQPGAAILTPLAQAARAADRLLVSLAGHTDWVSSAAFSPDGTRVLTSSGDMTAKIWDAQTGKELLTLRGHQAAVHGAAFNAAGTLVITASKDKTAKIWDAQTGRVLHTLAGHQGVVFAAAFSTDGTRVVTAGYDRTAKIWDAHSGQVLLVLKATAERVLDAEFSSDGNRVVTTEGDGAAKIWDAHSGQQMLVLKGHKSGIDSAKFNSSGTRVVTAGLTDRTARVWDADSGQELLIIPHGAYVTGAAFSADGTRVVTTSVDHTARVWDANTGLELLTLQGHKEYVRGARFSADGTRVVTSSGDQTAKVWDARNSEQLSLEGHRDSVHDAAFSADGTRVVTASEDKTAQVWDAHSGKRLFTLSGNRDGVLHAAFNPDGTRIVTESGTTVQVWDAHHGKRLFQLTGDPSWFVGFAGAAFSPDGTRLITSSAKTANVWDAHTGKRLLSMPVQTEHLALAAFTPDGIRLVGTSGSESKVWGTDGDKELHTLQGHRVVFLVSTFSADGTRLVTLDGDNTATIWDAHSGRELLTLQGHEGKILGAAFSADGTRVVTASNDGTAKVWDTQGGQELISLRVHDNLVASARFSADGTRVITAGWDRKVKIWEVAEFRSPAQIAELVRCRAGFRLDEQGRLQPTPPVNQAAVCPVVVRPESRSDKVLRAGNLFASAKAAAAGGNLQGAKLYGQQAVELYREQDHVADEAFGHLLLGEVSQRMGNSGEAQAQRGKAHAVYESMAVAGAEARGLAGLASFKLNRLHDPVAALADYDAARELLPSDPVIVRERAEAQFVAGRYELFLKDLPSAVNEKTLPAVRAVLFAYAWAATVLTGRPDGKQRAQTFLAAYKQWPSDQSLNWKFSGTRYALAFSKARPAAVARILALLALIEGHAPEQELTNALGLSP